MALLQAVENALESRKRTMSWLASEMDRTLEGFKLSLKNETIKYSDLKKMISILDTPIQFFFEGNTTVQKIRGNYNTQASDAMILHDPEAIYKKMEVEGLQKQVALLESQLIDKDKIIELLSNKKGV
jgi:hypothetical protein